MKIEKRPLLRRKYDFTAEFYDIDSMGVMWHGNYAKYAESARCKLLSEIGFTYESMRAHNFALPIIKMDFKFIAPIRFDEKFAVAVDLLDFEGIFKTQYIFYDSHAKTRCVAQISQVAFDFKNNETLYALPEIFCQKIANFIKEQK